MRILRHAKANEADRGAVLAIGNFDGVHLGHQTVIAEARARARAAGTGFAVLTFEPHPRSVFQPGTPPFRLTPFRSKARFLETLGVELLIACHFDLALAQKSAEDFVRDILVEGLGARHVVVGYDFVFGNRRRGTAALLRSESAVHGFGVSVVDPVTNGSGAVYASTLIREHLAGGRPRDAQSLLGRPWEIDGRVVVGQKLGRTIGFPTANVVLGEYLRPLPGVYAVRAGLSEGNATRWYPAAANLGFRPTVSGSDLRLEVHLFDYAGDLYGKRLRVAFIEHLRPEQKFSGLDALKAQIAEDCRRAREILARGLNPLRAHGCGGACGSPRRDGRAFPARPRPEW